MYIASPIGLTPFPVRVSLVSSLRKGQNNRSDAKQLIKIMAETNLTLPYQTVPGKNRNLKVGNVPRSSQEKVERLKVVEQKP